MNQHQKTNHFYELMDQAINHLIYVLQVDYLTGLRYVFHDLIDGINTSHAVDPTPLETIYQQLDTYTAEELRLGIYLLLVNALKDYDVNHIEAITPDAVGLLFAIFMEKWQPQSALVADLGLGSGNLSYLCYNLLQNKIRLLGIERDDVLVDIAHLSAEIQQIPITIYHNDWFDDFDLTADIIIGDIDSSDSSYVSRLLKNYSTKLNNGGLMLLLVNNATIDDYNADEDANYSMVGRLRLPKTMFQTKHQGKSIIVCIPNSTSTTCLDMTLPSLNEQQKVQNAIQVFGEWIEKVKGMIV